MPLTSAAQWVATKGNARDFAADDAEYWTPAFAELLAAISSKAVSLTGLKAGNRKKVRAYKISDCQICYPFQEPDPEVYFGDQHYLVTYTYDCDEEWRDGFSDKLVRRGKDKWTRLTVPKSQILARWPFPPSPGAVKAGRPSKGMNEILEELDRRDARDEAPLSQGDEASALLAWYRATYPDCSLPAKATVIKRVRAHRAQKAK